MGQELYNKKGCKTCHSVDGKTNTGPTWKGVFGRREEFVDGGSVTVDENYIRESILDPGKHVVKGFQNVMPKTTLSDPQIDSLIAYIKTLKE
jgi:cytochrome c oxidase subunit 2